jgi:hypothetical protein
MTHRARRSAPVVALALLVAAPSAAPGWGLSTHRWVAARAAELVDSRCPALGRGHGAALAAYAVEPDTVLKPRLGDEEETRHYVNLDHYGGPPFRALPRDHAAALRRHGRKTLARQGTLPWHGEMLARRLAREIGRGDERAARVSAGHLAHYAADATMPLHATANYDGQRSGQRGLHARVESRLVDDHLGRYVARASRVARRRPIAPDASAGALFAALEDSYDAVSAVLQADRVARRGTRAGSRLYYRRLDVELGELLATRIGAAAALTAALWEGACRAAPAEAR